MRRVDAAALELRGLVRPGDTIMWGQACGEPQTLTEALVAQRADLGGVSVFMGSCFSNTFRPEHADHIRMAAFGAAGTHRRLTRAGVLDILPCHVSRMEPYVAEGVLPCDVAFVQLAPPDEHGRYSLGLVSDENATTRVSAPSSSRILVETRPAMNVSTSGSSTRISTRPSAGAVTAAAAAGRCAGSREQAVSRDAVAITRRRCAADMGEAPRGVDGVGRRTRPRATRETALGRLSRRG